MAKYRITGPDGAAYEITAPDDATEDQVLAYAQANYQPQAQPERSMAERYAAAGIDPSAPDPTEGMSFVDKALAGFGQSLYGTARGVQQLFGQRSVEQVAEDRRLDAPLLDTGAGLVGNVIGQAAQIAAPVPGAATAKLASVAGRAAPFVGAGVRAGAFGGAQSVGEGETRTGNAGTSAAFGVAGQGIASGLGRVASAAKQKLSGPVQQSIEMARNAGIPLHLSQVTDSRFLKGAGSVANSLPFSGAAKAGRKQQEAFNRAIGRSFGVEDGATLSDDVMQVARSRIGAIYDDVYSRNNVTLDEQALSKLAALERSASRNLPPNEALVVKNQIDDILNATQDGAMSGHQYQAFRTDRLLPMESGGRTFQSALIREVRRALDDAAFRSVGPEDAKALGIARRQYRNMKTAEKALGQVAGAQGNVRPAALWPIVNQSRGATSEMRELAKIGQNVLKDPIPNSGTPERELILRLMGLGGAGALGGAPLSTLAMLAGGGMGVGRVMNSPLAASVLGQGRPISGLARLAQPAPRLLPAAAPAVGGINITGGTVATPEEIARDEEIVRRFREGR